MRGPTLFVLLALFKMAALLNKIPLSLKTRVSCKMRSILLALLAVASAHEVHLAKSGQVRGHESSQSPGVIEWLGIPYAQPPVGDLRFAPPQSYMQPSIYVASNYV